MGLFHNTWQQTQANYLQLNNLPNKHQQHQQAITAISHALLKHIRTLWEVRNQDLHGTNNHSPHPNKMATTNFKRTLLVNKVKELYTDSDNLLSIDKSLFLKPVNERTRESNHLLQQWIQFVRPIVRAGKKKAKELAKASHKALTTYFPTTQDDTQQPNTT